MSFEDSSDMEDIDQCILRIEKRSSLDILDVLYHLAKKIKPETYLELGVFKGRSMALVLKASPETNAYGIDIWKKHAGFYFSMDEVLASLEEIDIKKLPQLFSGFSQEILPELWEDESIPEFFDLILVDGDHTFKGAKKDLELCVSHLKEDGFLIFHDIAHPILQCLRRLIASFKMASDGYLFIESYQGNGFCLMTKRSFVEILNG